MTLQKAILIVAMISTMLPVVAAFLRERSRHVLTIATLLTAVAICTSLAIVLRLVTIGPQTSPNAWVYALMASGVPLLLAGSVHSLCFGRQRPQLALRDSRRTLILLTILGGAFLAMIGHHAFITGYDWTAGRGTLHLGSLGKAYLSYLLVGIVFVGYNLERTYRVSSIELRYRIRLAVIGLFGLLGFLTFILATGMLYASIGMGKLVASGLPIIFASGMLAFGYLRGAITDVTAPVSRKVVYSSFTAMGAGLFVIAIGAAAQVASLTGWSPDEILIVTIGFLVVLVGMLLLFSNRFQRSVRRYIDRNFYVNRYDYRAQWSSVTECLANATDRASVLDRTVVFLQDVFAADLLTIALRDEATHEICPVRGLGAENGQPVLEPDSPLARHLTTEGQTLLLDRSPHDFAYIPIYAESHVWLDATASQIVAPLLDNGELVGTLGLARRNKHDPFTYEDVALLDSIASHVGATLRAIRLAAELHEARESELLSQWSSMLLHDLKNHMVPLRLVAKNLIAERDDPQVALTCAQDIDRVADRLERVVQTLGKLRGNPTLGKEVLSPNHIVCQTASEMHLDHHASVTTHFHLAAKQGVSGDADMLRRVLRNLMVNALEAMDGKGVLTLTTRDSASTTETDAQVLITVRDTGQGIPEDFLRTKLFHAFATTKKRGLGLGLYQCRAIVRAHGGDLSVKSRLGEGTIFQIALAGVPQQPSPLPPLGADARAKRVAP
ncbi:MAG: GAF domain-containing protein [Candidatus Eisenbacteria sp.]|nr:GAF domain-containing protein [Candidatus Eisenbacteria bacterium]